MAKKKVGSMQVETIKRNKVATEQIKQKYVYSGTKATFAFIMSVAFSVILSPFFEFITNSIYSEIDRTVSSFARNRTKKGTQQQAPVNPGSTENTSPTEVAKAKSAKVDSGTAEQRARMAKLQARLESAAP